MSGTDTGYLLGPLGLMLGIGLLIGFCFLIIAIVRRKRVGVGLAVGGCMALVFLVAFGLAATVFTSPNARIARVATTVEQGRQQKGLDLVEWKMDLAAEQAEADADAEAEIQRAMATFRDAPHNIDSARKDFDDCTLVVIQGPPVSSPTWEEGSSFVAVPDDESAVGGSQMVCVQGKGQSASLAERHGRGTGKTTVKAQAQSGGKSAVPAKDRTTARIPPLPIQVGGLSLMILLAYLFVDARGRRRYTWARRITAAVAFTVVCLCLM